MPTLDQHPLFQELAPSQRILIAGAGGGFDVYCGLPLYFALKNQGKKVYLANYSFTTLEETDSPQFYTYCRKIVPETKTPSNNYFPEKHLAAWLERQREPSAIYAFEPTGVRHLHEAYSSFVRQHDLDTIILIDGGTDSLMHGDEEELGTPIEDATSLSAVYQLDVPQKYLLSIGFGIDEISHTQFLENVAALTDKGYLGAFSLSPQMREAQKFMEAVDYANAQMPGQESIICNSIISALEGHFGFYHRTSRTKHSKLAITPLMGLYWCFQLDAVVERLQYYPIIKDTATWDEVKVRIEEFRSIVKVRKAEALRWG